MPAPDNYAVHIRALRRWCELGTVEGFAQRLGVHPSLVSQWERGKHRPSDENWELIEAFQKQQEKLAEEVGYVQFNVQVFGGLPRRTGPRAPQGIKYPSDGSGYGIHEKRRGYRRAKRNVS